jgi:hypothetical protein
MGKLAKISNSTQDAFYWVKKTNEKTHITSAHNHLFFSVPFFLFFYSADKATSTTPIIAIETPLQNKIILRVPSTSLNKNMPQKPPTTLGKEDTMGLATTMARFWIAMNQET